MLRQLYNVVDMRVLWEIRSLQLKYINIHIGNSLQYLVIIREIKASDIDRGFLDALSILQKIKSNLLHKIFVAEDETGGKIAGTTTLLIEPKFINKGMKVGYIGFGTEDELSYHVRLTH